MLAETILYMEREEVTGPDYHPTDPLLKKWASQQGSVFIGGHKVKVNRPRLRGPEGEMRLKSYKTLQDHLPKRYRKEAHRRYRRAEGNLFRYRGSKMSRRWLGSCLLYAEIQFRRVKGYESIAGVMKNIECEHQEETLKKAA